MKRALAAPEIHDSAPIPAVNGDSRTPGVGATLPATHLSPQPPSRRSGPRASRKLESDGFLLEQAILVASFVDQPWVSLGLFGAMLGLGAVLCSILVVVCLRRFWGGGTGKRAKAQTSASAQKKVV